MRKQRAKNEAPPKQATRREWFGLAIIALPCMLYSMDLTVLHLAVPQLVSDLRPTSTELLWIVDIYGFLLAGALISMGVLGDRIGRRKLLLIGAAAFGLISMLAAFSQTAEMLIVSRALLGLAAATLAPSTLSLIRNMFADSKQRTFAVGIWVASFSAGAAIGPLIGGALLSQFWWGSVFLIAVPVMVVLLVLGPRLLPEYRDPHPGRVDITSAGLSLLAILAVVYGIKQMAGGEAGVMAVVAIVVGLVLGRVFLQRQRTLKTPFMNLDLFHSRGFSTMISVYVLIFFVSSVAFLFISLYLQLVLGMGPLEAGLWTLPWAIAYIIGSLTTPLLVRRIRPTFVVAGGLALSALGFFVLTLIGADGGLPVIVVGSFLFPLGLAPSITLATDLILGSVPAERAGMASGLSEAGSELGAALGIALIGSAATAFYRAGLDDQLPAGLSSEHAEAALATLGGALEVAGQLPVAVGDQLVATARATFIDSAVLGFVLCGLSVLAASLLATSAARKLKRAEKAKHSEN